MIVNRSRWKINGVRTLARTWRSRAILVPCGVSLRGLKCLGRWSAPLIPVEDGGNTAHAPEEAFQRFAAAGWRTSKKDDAGDVRVRGFHGFLGSNISDLFTWTTDVHVGFPKSRPPAAAIHRYTCYGNFRGLVFSIFNPLTSGELTRCE